MTEKQTQLATLIAYGYSRSYVAQRLDISLKTVNRWLALPMVRQAISGQFAKEQTQ